MALHPDDKMDKVSVLYYTLERGKKLFSGEFDINSENTITLTYKMEADLEDYLWSHDLDLTSENYASASDYFYEQVDLLMEDDLVELLNFVTETQISNAYVDHLEGSTIGYEIHITP